METHKVFGIVPQIREHSYIDRGSLDTELKKLISRKQTHVAIRGASKSGKSWLRQKVLDNPIVVQCRLSYTVSDIYRDALSRLDITVELEKSSSSTTKGRVSAAGEAGLALITKASGTIEVAHDKQTTTKERIIGKDISDLDFIASILRESGRILVIEDFHYLSVKEQKSFAFDLKTLWDFRTFVVIVGVWISENMLITLNPDLSDRIEELSVTWQPNELKAVLNKGCAALKLRPTNEVSDEIANISYESVGLLQKIALRLIDNELKITESPKDQDEIIIDNKEAVHDAAMHIADQVNQLYIAFARRVCEGIRTRNNSTGIYAHAMAAVMAADDEKLSAGLSAKDIYTVAHAREPRIQQGNLKTVLTRFPELQVDEEGRGLVLAYDQQDEKISVVDKQLLLFRKFATVKWPWEEIIEETKDNAEAYQGTLSL